MRKLRRLGDGCGDPLEGVANFFDVGIVFALGFLLALVVYLGLPELLEKRDVTFVKDPGTTRMEIIRKRGITLERYRVSRERIGGEGIKLGTAYRLKSGEVIYVPEDGGEAGGRTGVAPVSK